MVEESREGRYDAGSIYNDVIPRLSLSGGGLDSS